MNNRGNSTAPAIIVIAIAAAALLIGIAAAVYAVMVISEKPDDSTSVYSEPVSVSDDDAGTDGDAAQVTDAYTEKIDNGEGSTVSVRIPKIDITGGDAEEINDEIYDTLYALVESSYVPSIDYRWYVNGDILSLICECAYEDDYVEYTVYNVSASTGERLSTDDILEAVGCSEEEYLAGVENAVSDKELELWNMAGAGDYDAQLAASLDADNLRAAAPYLGENGDLYVIVKIWGFAGAEYYWYDIPAEPAEPAENTDDLFAVIGGKEYLYASGVGGWSETLIINSDGTFSGYVADGDMGIQTVWSCDYTGTFGNVTKISDYEYTIEVMTLDAPEFDDYVQDSTTYSYTAPYGIAQGMTFHVYLPGMATADMPSEYLDFGCVMYTVEGLDTFPCCGLYASDGGCYCETSTY